MKKVIFLSVFIFNLLTSNSLSAQNLLFSTDQLNMAQSLSEKEVNSLINQILEETNSSLFDQIDMAEIEAFARQMGTTGVEIVIELEIVQEASIVGRDLHNHTFSDVLPVGYTESVPELIKRSNEMCRSIICAKKELKPVNLHSHHWESNIDSHKEMTRSAIGNWNFNVGPDRSNFVPSSKMTEPLRSL